MIMPINQSANLKLLKIKIQVRMKIEMIYSYLNTRENIKHLCSKYSSIHKQMNIYIV